MVLAYAPFPAVIQRGAKLLDQRSEPFRIHFSACLFSNGLPIVLCSFGMSGHGGLLGELSEGGRFRATLNFKTRLFNIAHDEMHRADGRVPNNFR